MIQLQTQRLAARAKQFFQSVGGAPDRNFERLIRHEAAHCLHDCDFLSK